MSTATLAEQLGYWLHVEGERDVLGLPSLAERVAEHLIVERAIEADAAVVERARIEAAVTALSGGFAVSRAAVLAIVRGER